MIINEYTTLANLLPRSVFFFNAVLSQKQITPTVWNSWTRVPLPAKMKRQETWAPLLWPISVYPWSKCMEWRSRNLKKKIWRFTEGEFSLCILRPPSIEGMQRLWIARLQVYDGRSGDLPTAMQGDGVLPIQVRGTDFPQEVEFVRSGYPNREQGVSQDLRGVRPARSPRRQTPWWWGCHGLRPLCVWFAWRHSEVFHLIIPCTRKQSDRLRSYTFHRWHISWSPCIRVIWLEGIFHIAVFSRISSSPWASYTLRVIVAVIVILIKWNYHLQWGLGVILFA